jgi:hypothetical protein
MAKKYVFYLFSLLMIISSIQVMGGAQVDLGSPLSNDLKKWLHYRLGVNRINFEEIEGDDEKILYLTETLKLIYTVNEKKEDLESRIQLILSDVDLPDNAYGELFEVYIRAMVYGAKYWLTVDAIEYPFQKLRDADIIISDPFLPIVVSGLSDKEIKDIKTYIQVKYISKLKGLNDIDIINNTYGKMKEVLEEKIEENKLRPKEYRGLFWMQTKIEMPADLYLKGLGYSVFDLKYISSEPFFIENFESDLENKNSEIKPVVRKNILNRKVLVDSQIFNMIKNCKGVQFPTSHNNFCDDYKKAVDVIVEYRKDFVKSEDYSEKIDMLYHLSIFRLTKMISLFCGSFLEDGDRYINFNNESLDFIKLNGQFYVDWVGPGRKREHFLKDIEWVTKISETEGQWLFPLKSIGSNFTISERVDSRETGLYAVEANERNDSYSDEELSLRALTIKNNKDELIKKIWWNMFSELSYDRDFLIWFIENANQYPSLVNEARVKLQNKNNLYK